MSSYNKANVKFLSIVAYLGPLFIIGKFSFEKNCEQVRFHVKQGEILFCLMSFFALVSMILEYTFCSVLESFSIIFFLVNMGIGVMWLILAAMGVISACSGSKLSLPVVGTLANTLNKEG